MNEYEIMKKWKEYEYMKRDNNRIIMKKYEIRKQ